MSRLRYACLAMFYLTVGFNAYRNQRLPWAFVPIWHFIDVLIFFACGILLLATCVIDAKVRRHPFSDGGLLVISFTSPVSIAVYLIWSRGWRGVMWLVILLVGYFGVAFLGGTAANIVTQQQFLRGQ